MGFSTGVESFQRLGSPDSPPELASPGASSFSSRSSPRAEPAWMQRGTTSFSMPQYEKAGAAGLSMTPDGNGAGRQDRSEPSSQILSRQRLPPLHSLFGPSSAIRPTHSPFEPDASYLAPSPIEEFRVSPHMKLNTVSYFPLVSSSALRPRKSSISRRDDHASADVSRSTLPSPSLKQAQGRRSRSASRLQPESGRWSARQESDASEYSLISREKLYASPRDRTRTQLPETGKSARDYVASATRENSPSVTTAPESGIVSESAPAEDGLGPKIWTGDCFLPRYVKTAEVPGEGMCHFYDDGSHCRTVIDGELVTPHWGVTKAGKPRKRLAIACTTCREKKIKCNPAFLSCAQCDKFGRVCEFRNAHRGAHNVSPSTSFAEPEPFEGRTKGSIAERDNSTCSKDEVIIPNRCRISHRKDAPDTNHPNKRVKVGSDAYLLNGEPRSARDRHLYHTKPLLLSQPAVSDLSRLDDDALVRLWQTNPYVSDPQFVSCTVSQFFGHIHSMMIIPFLPENMVKSWMAATVDRKSPEDLMLLYSILAVGVQFSEGRSQVAHEYAQVAHFAQRSLKAGSLQLVQSRILLALSSIVVARNGDAHEMMSSAAAACAYLRLNEELDDHWSDCRPAQLPLDMTTACYAESRRRTLWSLVMLERLNPLFPARAPTIHAEDIFIRLPSDAASFEKQLDAEMPMFNPYEVNISSLNYRLTNIDSHLVEMVHTWTSCQSTIHRMAKRSHGSGTETLRIHSLNERIRSWQSTLPSKLTFGVRNLEAVAFSGQVGSFLTMHLLFHHTLLQLNRYQTSVAELTVEQRAAQIRKCGDSAKEIIGVIHCMERVLRNRPGGPTAMTPVMSTVLVTAVDVLSAAGSFVTIDETIDDVKAAKAVIENVARLWEHARLSQFELEQRLRKLCVIRAKGRAKGLRPCQADDYRVDTCSTDLSDLPHWSFQRPLERSFPVVMDVVYCLSR